MDPSILEAILLVKVILDLWDAELVQEILNEEKAEKKNNSPTSVESMNAGGLRASGVGENDSEQHSEDKF